MTIIRPSVHQSYIQFLLLLFVALIIAGAFYISEYNVLVDTRHELKVLREKLVTFQSQNADLKNELYKKVDRPNLEASMGGRNLNLDKNPEYLNNDQWLSDSSH